MLLLHGNFLKSVKLDGIGSVSHLSIYEVEQNTDQNIGDSH